MTRCLNCNCILRADEPTCYACNAPAPVDPSKHNNRQRFASILTILFFLSLALVVCSVFTDLTPPFSVCVAVSVILMLVRSSARQMSESGNR